MIHLRPIGYRSKARARRELTPVTWRWSYFWLSIVVSAAMWLAIAHVSHWLYVNLP